ncbi:hypothetical protein ACHAXR_004297, partial [Thalassiosira sp. AJA248-18]
MGHSFSIPRQDSPHGSGNHAAVATSLAILLAVASATTSSSSQPVSASSSSCSSRCCFIPPHSTTTTFFGGGTTTTTTSSLSSSLHATATTLPWSAATVPPPNSRLGQRGLRQQQSKRKGNKNKQTTTTDLRYASYCNDVGLLLSGDDDGLCNIDDTEELSMSSWKSLISSGNKANAMEEEQEEEEEDGSTAIAKDTNPSSSATAAAATMIDPGNNQTTFQSTQDDDLMKNTSKSSMMKRSRGKRARMLRFLDKRISRLQLKALQKQRQQTSSVKSTFDSPPSSKSNNDQSNNSNNNRQIYEEQKAAWAAKYTSVSTLRKSFGTNKNRLWGDFDPPTTRRLYHTLLPRALLELRGLRDGLLTTSSSSGSSSKEDDGLLDGSNNGGNDCGSGGKNKKKETARSSPQQVNIINGGATTTTPNFNHPDDYPNNNNNNGNNNNNQEYLQEELKELAPLAYQARLAAKKYARERSRLPGRIGSMLYDGYRSWRRYGKWRSGGMTWEQVWNKYEDQVLREAMEELEDAAVIGEDGNDHDEATSSSSRALIDGNTIGGLPFQGREDLDDEELTARICLRILERSVVTNDAIDKLFLKRLASAEDVNEEEQGGGGGGGVVHATTTTTTNIEDVIAEESRKRLRRRQERQRAYKLRIQADLAAIEKKFDDDVRELLRYSNLTTREGEERRGRRKRG